MEHMVKNMTDANAASASIEDLHSLCLRLHLPNVITHLLQANESAVMIASTDR